ncbi:hypothetical protein BJX63DRAFT_136423 [Aspergillus granulosus]|uniref:Uncharacterized protein n=1 Tax=Aspergillus granulosus TaxID=176169 RepID=A0ABR4GU58_9EURO
MLFCPGDESTGQQQIERSKNYLEDPQFAAEDKPILQRAINAGVKLLVIEESSTPMRQIIGFGLPSLL